MNSFKSSGKSDYKTEKQIIEKFSYLELIEKLTPFYADSTTVVRQKAYQFTYRKGLTSEANTQKKVVLKLLAGCKDKNGGIVGQLFSYLQEFPPESFDESAKNTIDNLLDKKQITHFKKLAMLAGMVGAGQETMQKKFLMPEVKNETKWALALALARQGSNKHTKYCVELVKNISINSDLVAYLIPDLIYTRQNQAINYCIEIIHSNKKDCYSPNPDKPEFILCAYRIMELLAPVIIDFPLQTDATGSLATNDYEEALKITRNWFINNPTYQISR
ncbi:MAG: hypothetical protein GQ564_10110 [Bacteroidales bacterium]|nr:hypothetical protein [Bacteroidales bacterium]